MQSYQFICFVLAVVCLIQGSSATSDPNASRWIQSGTAYDVFAQSSVFGPSEFKFQENGQLQFYPKNQPQRGITLQWSALNHVYIICEATCCNIYRVDSPLQSGHQLMVYLANSGCATRFPAQSFYVKKSNMVQPNMITIEQLIGRNLGFGNSGIINFINNSVAEVRNTDTRQTSYVYWGLDNQQSTLYLYLSNNCYNSWKIERQGSNFIINPTSSGCLSIPVPNRYFTLSPILN